jgi:threonine/homoserine/homoserine lactone efflux protein
MAVKIFSGIIAVILMVAYNAVAVIKLQEIALAVVGLIGIVMMAWDLWDSLKQKED